MNAPNSSFKFCPHCGSALPGGSRFCPGCGVALSGATPATGITQVSIPSALSNKQWLIIAAVALGIFVPVWAVQKSLTGDKPTQTFAQMSGKPEMASMGEEPHGEQGTETLDPETQKLVDAAAKSPNNLAAQQAAASALVNQIRSTETPSRALVLDSIEVLGNVLKLKPDDKDALIAMADINFNQQVIGKAVGYYERYLKVSKGDLSARARYGSALSMLGKFDQGIKQLKMVLDKEPKNFQAAAYLSITYAQMGNQKEALSVGATALANAPTDESRTRFAKFLDEIRTTPQTTSPERGNVTEEKSAPIADTQQPMASDESLLPVTSYITTNDIAGRKFVGAARNGSTIELYFREFPMEGMPPFVKDKFVNSIKMRATKISGVTALKFIDRDSGQVMVESKL